MGEQAGGAAVGELLEGQVDPGLELGKGGRVAGQLLGPQLLLSGKRRLDLLKSLIRCRHFITGFGTNANLHGRILAGPRLLDTSAILPERDFLGSTAWERTLQTYLEKHHKEGYQAYSIDDVSEMAVRQQSDEWAFNEDNLNRDKTLLANMLKLWAECGEDKPAILNAGVAHQYRIALTLEHDHPGISYVLLEQP